jgi:AcrR family transcriptional regulator
VPIDPALPVAATAPRKSDRRRADIIDRLADHVLAHGLAGASLRPLAEAAQLSDRMLLYYFPDKAAIIAAVLERVAERLTALLGARTGTRPLPVDALLAALHGVLFSEEVWPYLQLFLEVTALAGRGEAVARGVGERLGRGFLAWGAAQLDSPAETRAHDAARLLVMVEGMMVLKSLGLADVNAAALPKP